MTERNRFTVTLFALQSNCVGDGAIYSRLPSCCERKVGGRQVQREFAGTERKSETEALLRKAMEDYESKKFVAKSENATVGMLLDMWVEEELKPGNLSNGTVMPTKAPSTASSNFPSVTEN